MGVKPKSERHALFAIVMTAANCFDRPAAVLAVEAADNPVDIQADIAKSETHLCVFQTTLRQVNRQAR